VLFVVILLLIEKSDRRRFLLTARDMSMTTGDYVFFTFDILPEVASSLSSRGGTIWWSHNDGHDEKAADALESVFHVSTWQQVKREMTSFHKNYKHLTEKSSAGNVAFSAFCYADVITHKKPFPVRTSSLL
jgi:hypothetical protein